MLNKQTLRKAFQAFARRRVPKPAVFRRQEERDGLIDIIFLLPNTRYASGGMIVSHNHSDKINGLGISGVQSSILYPEEPAFRPDFFQHNSRFKSDLKFSPRKDFVLIPEVQALRYAKSLRNIGVKYGIHVQNGYLMDLEVRVGLGSHQELKEAYHGASILIGNSNDSTENISLAFPGVEDRIIRSYFVIDKAAVRDIAAKKNVITYMPRKLSTHSKHVQFFLRERLPENWQLVPIDGVSEQTVYDMLQDSKIFLSFSEFEGLAMPPVMAALSGNHVIGYTGEGNKEYFHLPCFEEVPCGDIKLFVQKILDAVARFDRNEGRIEHLALHELQDLFSVARQEAFLEGVALRAVDLLTT